MSTNIGSLSAMMTTSKSIDRGYRFPADVIEQAVWLYFRLPLSLRMVEDLLAARGSIVSHEAVRCWAETFGRIYGSKICRRAPQFGDTWHLDEVVISINGKRPCHVRAVDADGFVLDAPVQSREGRRAAESCVLFCMTPRYYRSALMHGCRRAEPWLYRRHQQPPGTARGLVSRL